MKNQFYFENFEPEFKLRFQANLVLSRIMDNAPYGSTSVALLVRQSAESYHCALDIYSQQGPLIANAVGATPEQALNGMEEKMKKQCERWKSHRVDSFSPSKLPFAFAALAVS